MARMAMNVRTVVGIDGDPRVVGALLHPSMDLIVGAIQGTPAAALSEAELSEVLGMAWAAPLERVALRVAVGVPESPEPLDGGRMRRALDDATDGR
jgi:hypothetical protein